MKLLRLGRSGHERPAVSDNDRIYDLSSVTDDIDGAFLESHGIERTRTALKEESLPILDNASELRIGSPIARPAAVICIGQNYAAHAAESGSEPPTRPIVFFKHPNTVVGPNDSVPIPTGSTTTDWEVELGVVIGRRTHMLAAPEAAHAQIAGYVLANDVSERDLQIELSGGQWGKGKSCPAFCPVGPEFIPADEIDPSNLGIRSWVNGQARQDSITKDMIFTVPHIVHDLSQYMTLEPGDLILTGTPEGVAFSGRYPYLTDGDVVELEIDELGRQTQKFYTTTDSLGRY